MNVELDWNHLFNDIHLFNVTFLGTSFDCVDYKDDQSSSSQSHLGEQHKQDNDLFVWRVQMHQDMIKILCMNCYLIVCGHVVDYEQEFQHSK